MTSVSKQKERLHYSQLLPKLEAWWGEKFVKVPASGALRWGGEGSFWTYGDIVPPKSFPFCVEMKNHEFFDIDDCLHKDIQSAKLTWFWYWQTIRDANRATEELGVVIYPILVYKQHATANRNRLVIQDSLFALLPQELRSKIPHVLVSHSSAQPFVVSDLKVFCSVVTRPLFEKHILQREV